MEKIAMILFAALALLVLLLGSIVIAWLFVIIGDGWEYRREVEKEGNEDKVGKEGNEDKVGKEVSNG